MTTLLDPKSTHEINALKGIALDHVGVIAARIRMDRSMVLKLEGDTGDSSLKTLQEVRFLDNSGRSLKLTRWNVCRSCRATI